MAKKALVLTLLAVGMLVTAGAEASNNKKRNNPYTPKMVHGRGVAVPELSAGPTAASALALLAGGLLVASGRRRRKTA